MLDTFDKRHDHSHAQNRYAVIPTPEKLGVDGRFTGRGVRIAFLDSGFYPHPDFAERVIAFHDIAGEERSIEHVLTPAAHHWHGTQTVTACAGSGRLSEGIYRGLAHRAELVLVKVSRAGRIGDAEIEAGLRWIVEHREPLAIGVLNISLGGDCDLPTHSSRINQLIEELTSSGVVVTVAAGNSAESRSAPPASAPSAITVGGYSDENQFTHDSFDLYHSSHGTTADGIVKPELVGPAMFVAAPILPETSDHAAAEALSILAAAPDYSFAAMLEENWRTAGFEENVVQMDRGSARELVESSLRRRKIVATHYQHVDGTSFAAPITASLVALLLEANPRLTPAGVKSILISTARRISGRPALRQGFGVLNGPAAIAAAASEIHTHEFAGVHPPLVAGREIVFRHHDDDAKRVMLAGDFNDWNAASTCFERCSDGLWRASIACQPPGTYRYKLLIDDSRWIEDPSHGLKEDDGLGGFHSLLFIE